MGFLKPKKVKPVNVAQSTEQIQKANLQAGQQSQGLSAIGQVGPYGTLKYTTEIDPITGLPKYVANTQYSEDQQNILDWLEMGALGAGESANNLIQNLFPQYEGDPNLLGGANSLTAEALDSMSPHWERFMGPAREQLDTQLRNQGILPNTPAYHQQMDALLDQQLRTKGAWLAEYQPKAFEMTKQEYQLPLANAQALLSMLNPANLKGSLVDTPGANIGPADVMGLIQANQEGQKFNAQQSNAFTNAIMSGLIGGATSFMGGPAAIGGKLGKVAGNTITSIMGNGGGSPLSPWFATVSK